MTIKTLSTLVMAVLFTGCFSGCTTTETGRRVVDPVVADKVAPVLTGSVAGAVVYAYTRDKNSEKYLGALKTALQEFLVSDDLSASALQARLYNLPIKELKTPEAQLIIAPLLGAYRAIADQIVKDKTKTDPGLQRLVTALIAGLDEGLNAIAAIKSAPSSFMPSEHWQRFAGLDHVVKAMIYEIDDRTYPSGG